MTTIKVQWVIRQAFCLVCVPLLAGGLMVAQQPAPPAQAPAQLLSPEQLNTLVAPVALYPDALLSQVLVAATYPIEISEAEQWLQQNPNLQGPQLVDAARQQNWDPSIQALVVFPDVINRLAADIRWTTDLGNAFLSQQTDVMNAVQQMRAQAMAAGKLQSNPQQIVTTEMQGDQSAIEIQPANPEVVYVPYYNPEYIWGPPRYGYYPAWDYPGFGIGFGFGFGHGIYIGGFFGGLAWGGWGWGPNWFHCSINQNRYFFDHYGYGGHGYRGGTTWAHDPGHRQGVPYPNSTLNQRYGGNRTVPSYRSSPSWRRTMQRIRRHESVHRRQLHRKPHRAQLSLQSVIREQQRIPHESVHRRQLYRKPHRAQLSLQPVIREQQRIPPESVHRWQLHRKPHRAQLSLQPVIWEQQRIPHESVHRRQLHRKPHRAQLSLQPVIREQQRIPHESVYRRQLYRKPHRAQLSLQPVIREQQRIPPESVHWWQLHRKPHRAQLSL